MNDKAPPPGSQLETLVADVKFKPYNGEVRLMIPILEIEKLRIREVNLL